MRHAPVKQQLGRMAALFALLFSFMLSATALAEPAYVIVKLPIGAKAPDDLFERLSSWRQSGQVADVLVLNKAEAENASFDKFITLEFPSEGSYEAWVKEGQPQLAAPLEVVRVDVLTHGEKTPRDSNMSLFKVNDYQPTTSADETRKFAQGYIKPLMDGQVAARLMMRYTMYLERVPKGKTWLLMEYRDRSEERRVGKE